MCGWVYKSLSQKQRTEGTITWSAEDGDINFHGFPVSLSPAKPGPMHAASDLT